MTKNYIEELQKKEHKWKSNYWCLLTQFELVLENMEAMVQNPERIESTKQAVSELVNKFKQETDD